MTSPPVVVLRARDGATAGIHHDGAHVTSWRPAPEGDERLFLSGRTELRAGVAIRGGIPVIFPQFAAEGPLPRHGFARTTRWTLDAVERRDDGDAEARFALRDTAATRAVWPVSFAASLAVRVGGPRLAVSLGVENTHDAPIDFTAALHTYLRVNDVEQATLEGLCGHRYRESTAPGVLRADTDAVLRPVGEVDRVYVAVPNPVVLREPRRAVEMSSRNLPDVVVWNPGEQKAAKMADMEPGGWRRMLCVEAAAVQERIVLQPGERWEGVQRLRALPAPA